MSLQYTALELLQEQSIGHFVQPGRFISVYNPTVPISISGIMALTLEVAAHHCLNNKTILQTVSVQLPMLCFVCCVEKNAQ